MGRTLVVACCVALVACGSESAAPSGSSTTIHDPAAGRPSAGTTETARVSTRSTESTVATSEASEDWDFSDESPAEEVNESVVDLVGQISLTDAIVSASSVTPMDPLVVENRDGEQLSFAAVDIAVRDLLLDGIWGTGAPDPDVGTTTSAISVNGHDAVREPVTGQLIVGLQALPTVYTEVVPQHYAVTFVAQVSDGDGVDQWSYLGPHGEQFDRESQAMADALGLESSFEVVSEVVEAYRQLNRPDGDGTGLNRLLSAVERLRNGDPAESWRDAPVDQRPFTVDGTPEQFLEHAEAIGLEFVYDGSTASSQDDTIVVRSREGVSHAFSSGVGSHLALALRVPTERLRIAAVRNTARRSRSDRSRPTYRPATSRSSSCRSMAPPWSQQM